MKSIFTSITFCMLIFFVLLLSFADFSINISLLEQFFPKHHQSIKLFKNPDFVSLYLGPKCLQRLSADDKSHWKELNILMNYNNCFHFFCQDVKRRFSLEPHSSRSSKYRESIKL